MKDSHKVSKTVRHAVKQLQFWPGVGCRGHLDHAVSFIEESGNFTKWNPQQRMWYPEVYANERKKDKAISLKERFLSLSPTRELCDNIQAGVLEVISVWQVGALELEKRPSCPLGLFYNLSLAGFSVVAIVWLVSEGLREQLCVVFSIFQLPWFFEKFTPS